MGADGHRWVCEGANEYIGAGGHEKKARWTTNGRGGAETDTLRTSENRARNRYTHNIHRGERRGIWGTEGDEDDRPGGPRKPGTRTHEKEYAKTAATSPNLNNRTTVKMSKNVKIMKRPKKTTKRATVTQLTSAQPRYVPKSSTHKKK